MALVIDTSVVIAVLLNEPHKQRLVEITARQDLFAPASLFWEIDNAFSAMFKRNRVSLDVAQQAVQIFKKIPIQFIDVDMNEALKIANEQNIYAYEAYFLACATHNKCPLVSLDAALLRAAQRLSIQIIEVKK